MALSPVVLVQDGAGPWVSTTNGVDVTPGNTISIKLLDTTDATDWYLQVLGTDELITAPSLTGVNPLDNKVTTTTTVVTFTMPSGTGHALRFQSQVLGVGGPLTTTFGIYSLTLTGKRVGASTEEREGNGTYGWITILNPLIRGGGFTPGGDLSGDSVSQIVSKIQGIPSPNPASAYNNWSATVVEDFPDPSSFYSPRSVVTDGTYLYVAQSSQEYDVSYWGGGVIRKMLPSGDGTTLEVVAEVDLVSVLPTVDRIRDLAIDSTYIYATCWDTENTAIISKATMTIVGWGWTGAGSRAISVCADDAGNFYVYQNESTRYVGKFSTAACLGQPPSTVGPSLTYNNSGRFVRFGGGYVWLTQGSAIRKIDPATMTQVASSPAYTMSALYAFGSLWVTEDSGRVERLDPVSMAVTNTILLPISDNPSELVLGPDSAGTPNARIYVSDENWIYTYVINPNTNTLEKVYTTGGFHTEGIATIGDVVYVMSFLEDIYGSRPGIFFINHVTGTTGAVTYKPQLEYRAQSIADSRRISHVVLNTGMWNGQVGQFPKVRDTPTICYHMISDRRLTPDLEEGPFIWIARREPNDVAVFDLYTAAHYWTIPLLPVAGHSFRPHTLAISPKYVWALGWPAFLVKIDRVTKEVLDYHVTLPVEDCEGLAWDEAHNAILTTMGSNEDGVILSIDASTHKVTRHAIAGIDEVGKALVVVGTSVFYFGYPNFWKVDTTTWTAGAPVAIPGAVGGRIRAIYEAGYIFFVSQGGSQLTRIDPVTTTTSNLYVGTTTQDLAYDVTTPAICVTCDTPDYKVQQVTSPTGVMAIGNILTLAGHTMRGIAYDPTNEYFYLTAEALVTPRDTKLLSFWRGSSGAISTYPVNYLNGQLEWAAPSVTLAGDVTGASGSNTVVRLQGRNVSSSAPGSNQVLTWSGSQWQPATPSSGSLSYQSDGSTLGSITTLNVTGRQSRRTFGSPTGTLSIDEPSTGRDSRMYEHSRSNEQHSSGGAFWHYLAGGVTYRDMVYWDGPEGAGSGQRGNTYWSTIVPVLILLDFGSGTATVNIIEAFSGTLLRSFGTNGATTGWYRLALTHNPESPYSDKSRIYIGKDNNIQMYTYTSGTYTWNITTNVGTSLSRFFQPLGCGYPYGLWWVDSGGLKQIGNTQQGTLPSVTILNATIPAAYDFVSDGYHVYISCPASNAVYKVDATTGTTVSGWPKTVTGARGLAFDGRYVWVTNSTGTPILTALDPVTGSTVGTFSNFNSQSGALELTFDGTFLWLLSGGTMTLTKIDPRLASGGSLYAIVGEYTTSGANGDYSRIIPIRLDGGRGGWAITTYTSTGIYLHNNPRDAWIANLRIEGGGIVQTPWNRSITGAPHQLSARHGMVHVESGAGATAYTLLLPKRPPSGTRILITDISAGVAGYGGALTVTITADASDRLMGTLGGSTTLTNSQTKEFIFGFFQSSVPNWVWR